ncbi:MAG: YitT family protein [Myxococcales bacterium]|nr:YitT family protein [Myxococcales bacterium]
MKKIKSWLIADNFNGKKFAWRMFLIALGGFISAAGVNLFLVPFKLLTAGVAGIALLIYYLTPVLSVGTWMFILNIPIFVAGWILVNRKFVLWSLVGMVSLSFFLDLTKSWAELRVVDDLYMSLILGGLLSGVGVGLAFRARGSMGGTDIVAAIMRKYYSTSIGSTQFALNGVIVMLLGLRFTMEAAFASAFSIWFESYSMDRTILGFNKTMALIVITAKPHEVGDALMNKLNRGVTYLRGFGGYTCDEKELVYCIITNRQLSHAKAIVEKVDPHSFTTVTSTVEVIGQGFKRLPI